MARAGVCVCVCVCVCVQWPAHDLRQCSSQLERAEVKKLKDKAKAALEKATKTGRDYNKEVTDANKYR